MEDALKTILWSQFGATVDMLENAVTACPDELWVQPSAASPFWYMAYHTLFWLDYYLSEDAGAFKPPAPFTLSEFDPSGKMPDRVYTKEELLNYLQYGRKKCHARIMGLAEDGGGKRFVNAKRNYSAVEILLYNMRHVQHHTAQLNLLLRQGNAEPPKWVSRTVA